MLPKIANINGNILGFLQYCSKCEVTEEKNGDYYLEIETTTAEPLADKLLPNMIILAKPNSEDNQQMFVIYSVQIQNQNISIQANHIKYCALQSPFGNVSAEDEQKNGIIAPTKYEQKTVNEVFNDIKLNAITYPHFLNLNTNFTNYQKKNISTEKFWNKKVGEFLSDEEGGILDVYGGVYSYNNQAITLNEIRGNQNPRKIYYSGTLEKQEATFSSDSAYTHVVAYAEVDYIDAQGNKSKKQMHGHPKAVQGASDFEYPNILLVDGSTYLRDNWHYGNYTAVKYDDPTVIASGTPGGENYLYIENRLNEYAEQYIKSNNINAYIKINMEITDKAALDDLQDLKLCDRVEVILSTGKSVDSEITKVTFDSQLERYVMLHIGERALSLGDFLKIKRR